MGTLQLGEKVINSPLRYVGGKHSLFSKLGDYLPDGTREIVSPFLGGGAVELNWALRGIQVYGYDVCPHLVNFWQYWVKSPGSIEQHAKEVLATRRRDEIQAIKTDFKETGYRGAVLYYVCNRVAFGGQSLKNPHVKAYEVINGRFAYPLYRTQTRRRYVFPHSEFWQTFPPVPLTVRHADFKESLSKHRDIFAYLDPPYFGKEEFYLLEGFDHEGLSKMLKGRKKWILSYNDHPCVQDLYSGYDRLSINGRNFSTGKRTSPELLIFSHDIAERLEYRQHFLF